MTADRRIKSPMTHIVEVVTLLIGLGVCGLLVQIGEYKKTIEVLQCSLAELKTEIAELRHSIDVKMAATNVEIEKVKWQNAKTVEVLAAHTGMPVR